MAVVVAAIAADGSGRSSGSTLATVRTRCSGEGSSPRSSNAAWAGFDFVISDQHAGLVKALRRSFQGAGHQRCRVHFARDL